MSWWGGVRGLLCAWVACVALGLAVPPSAFAGQRAAVEQVAREERELEREGAPAEAAARVECSSDGASGAQAWARCDVEMRKLRLAVEHLVLVPEIYLKHCAWLC